MTFAGGTQKRQKRLRAVHHAPEVDPHDPLKILNLDRASRRGVRDPAALPNHPIRVKRISTPS